jgi:hypothetical protein
MIKQHSVGSHTIFDEDVKTNFVTDVQFLPVFNFTNRPITIKQFLPTTKADILFGNRVATEAFLLRIFQAGWGGIQVRLTV